MAAQVGGPEHAHGQVAGFHYVYYLAQLFFAGAGMQMHYARLAGKHATHARRVAKARKLLLRYAGAAVV